MRLISQDGRYDIPYDMSPLYVFKSCDEWQVRTVDTMLGHYSTEEKALKVMEMVRNAYAECMTSKCFFAGMMSVIAKFDETTSKAIEKAAKEAYIFQFPKDNEVEV